MVSPYVGRGEVARLGQPVSSPWASVGDWCCPGDSRGQGSGGCTESARGRGSRRLNQQHPGHREVGRRRCGAQRSQRRPCPPPSRAGPREDTRIRALGQLQGLKYRGVIHTGALFSCDEVSGRAAGSFLSPQPSPLLRSPGGRWPGRRSFPGRRGPGPPSSHLSLARSVSHGSQTVWLTAGHVGAVQQPQTCGDVKRHPGGHPQMTTVTVPSMALLSLRLHSHCKQVIVGLDSGIRAPLSRSIQCTFLPDGRVCANKRRIRSKLKVTILE